LRSTGLPSSTFNSSKCWLRRPVGDADPNLQHDLGRYGLSSPWATAAQRAGSKMLPDDIVNLSVFLITGRTVQYLAWLVLHLRDDPSVVSRQQIDDVLQHLDLARNTLITRLNHYQLLASGLDCKSAGHAMRPSRRQKLPDGKNFPRDCGPGRLKNMNQTTKPKAQKISCVCLVKHNQQGSQVWTVL